MSASLVTISSCLITELTLGYQGLYATFSSRRQNLCCLPYTELVSYCVRSFTCHSCIGRRCNVYVEKKFRCSHSRSGFRPCYFHYHSTKLLRPTVLFCHRRFQRGLLNMVLFVLGPAIALILSLLGVLFIAKSRAEFSWLRAFETATIATSAWAF